MRVVSLAPSNTEILYKLGLEKRIVATTSLCSFPPEAVEKPSVGGWTEGVDIQKIEGFNPDKVVLSDSLQEGLRERLEERGIETVHLKPECLDEVYGSILKLGRIFGEEGRAEEINRKMRAEIEEVNLGGKKIYCEEWMDPPMVSGNWVVDLIQRGGGRYFLESSERSRRVSLDEVESFNPEFIFANICGAGKNFRKGKISGRDGWGGIKAVKNGNIEVIDDSLLNTPGPRLVEGLKLVEKTVKQR